MQIPLYLIYKKNAYESSLTHKHLFLVFYLQQAAVIY